MISAWICSAAWRRFDVTRLALSQRQRLCEELAARGIQATSLVVADDENLDIARELGSVTLEAPNEPLGRKWNVALRYAAERADWVIWVGSDDWIHPDAFAPLTVPPETGPARIIRGGRVTLVDLASGQLQRVSSASKYGAIPWLIESRLIRATRKDSPIRPDLLRGLDGGLIRGLRRSPIPFELELHDPHEFRCVDFKSDQNLSSFAAASEKRGLGEPEPAWAVLAKWFPADLVDQARALSDAQREEAP